MYKRLIKIACAVILSVKDIHFFKIFKQIENRFSRMYMKLKQYHIIMLAHLVTSGIKIFVNRMMNDAEKCKNLIIMYL